MPKAIPSVSAAAGSGSARFTADSSWRLRPRDPARRRRTTRARDEDLRGRCDRLDVFTFERRGGIGAGPAIERTKTGRVDLDLVARCQGRNQRTAHQDPAGDACIGVGVRQVARVDDGRRSGARVCTSHRALDHDRANTEMAVDRPRPRRRSRPMRREASPKTIATGDEREGKRSPRHDRQADERKRRPTTHATGTTHFARERPRRPRQQPAAKPPQIH